MILPDVNLLLYAHNTLDPKHEAARCWWDAHLAGRAGIGLAWVVLLGFIRLSTHPRVFTTPFRPSEVTGRIAEWLSLPHVKIIHPSDQHFTVLAALIEKAGTAGNLTTDAHLAALAIERGLILQTTDADFARFPGLKWHNPLL
jgi:uncharacterized protein